MEFFNYQAIAQLLFGYKNILAQIIFASICFLIVFAFKCAALYRVSKREEYSHRWMAFIPFLNTYYMGVCSKKNDMRSIKIEFFALITMFLEMVVFGLMLFSYIQMCQLVDYANIKTVVEGNYQTQIIEYVGVPADMQWKLGFINMNSPYSMLSALVELAYLVCQCFLISAYFKTYGSIRYGGHVLVSVFLPIQGIVMFTTSNRRAKNYNEYVLKERERIYRTHQQGQYYGSNPYAQPRNNTGEGNPFDDFPESNGSGGGTYRNENSNPFDDF